MSRFAIAAAMVVATSATPAAAQSDQQWLPSWNDHSKSAILHFVHATTTEGGDQFVAPEDRVAVFDNDGTLWAERPVYFQLLYALDRVRRLAPHHPEWQELEPFAAVLRGDDQQALAGGKAALLQLMAATHAGMTTDEFANQVRNWLQTAKHPRFNCAFTELTYQPMQELLKYLRANGFKTYIVSGGGIDFMRVFAEEVYGIPPEQVIGSSITTRYETKDGKPRLVRLPEIAFIDDKAGKPVAIHHFIGRRPIAAFGNSDGDLQMLEWTAAGEGASFCMLIHHTDARREWAYDRDSTVGRLDDALRVAKVKGWTVVDMQRDWKRVFSVD